MTRTRIETRSDAKSESETSAAGERIAKRMARAGLCSRRDAERWIAEGRVAVGGVTLTTPAHLVRPGDLITVDGRAIPEDEPTRLFRYHKPSGLVTTARDEKGRTTIFDRLPPELPRVVTVGRLDLTSEGLLLLTNDGELKRFLEMPSTGWVRRYRVRAYGAVDEEKLARLSEGVTVNGVRYGPIEAKIDSRKGWNSWLTIGLREGRNREIRKVLESLGLEVSRLIRTAYGPFQLGKLPEGAVEEIPRRVLKDQLSAFLNKGQPERASQVSPISASDRRDPDAPRRRDPNPGRPRRRRQDPDEGGPDQRDPGREPPGPREPGSPEPVREPDPSETAAKAPRTARKLLSLSRRSVLPKHAGRANRRR